MSGREPLTDILYPTSDIIAAIEEYMLVSARSLKIELYRKEQNKWVYYAYGPNEDIDLAVHFPVADAYEGINPEEDFSTREENDTFPQK